MYYFHFFRPAVEFGLVVIRLVLGLRRDMLEAEVTVDNDIMEVALLEVLKL